MVQARPRSRPVPLRRAATDQDGKKMQSAAGRAIAMGARERDVTYQSSKSKSLLAVIPPQRFAEHAERDRARDVLGQAGIASFGLLELVGEGEVALALGFLDQAHRLVAAHDDDVLFRGNRP